jgi:polysaccharide biosynthesis protein PslG
MARTAGSQPIARNAMALLTALTVAGTLLIGNAASADAASYIDDTTFGLHVPRIADGAVPSVSYGTVRLWDSGVSWGQVEQRKGGYWWVGLDRAIGAANAQGAEILYVLGSTPTWAASNRSQGTYPNRGAASNPRSLTDWKRWVTAVVRRHGNSIDSYQIWNEANLRTFWQGTPAQMARLTLAAKRIIRNLDPTAKVVAASSTVRLTSAFNRFFPAYLTQLRKRGWPVDVFAIHTYGPSTASPALRATYVAKARRALRAARAPARPLWDTEVNYGIKGPGPRYPDKDIGGTKAAIYVAQTYLDGIRLRIARTYWYAWSPPTNLLGITLFDRTTGAAAYQTTFDWTANAWVTCRTGPVNSCVIDRSASRAEVAWTSAGHAQPYVVPANATRACTALNACRAVPPGSTVSVGRMPIWFGPEPAPALP